MKNVVDDKKGITLIALIITIIVMLILVAVTITVALNGGIFNNATDAKVKTQKAADKEILLSAVMGTLNNKGELNINKSNIEEQLTGQNWTVTNNGDTLKCKNNDTNMEYYVNKITGKIEEKNEISLIDGNYCTLESGTVVEIKVINGEFFVYDEEEDDFVDTSITITSNYITDGENSAPAEFIVLRDENDNIINKIFICYSVTQEPMSLTCVTSNQDIGTTHLTEGKYYLNGDSTNTNDYIEINKGEFYDEYSIVIEGNQIENFAYGDESLAGLCINGNIYNRDGRIIGIYNKNSNTIVYEENNYTLPSV